MAMSIDMAINKLNIDLSEVRGTFAFYTAVESYLEAVFHQKVDGGEFKYFDTLIELSHIDIDDEDSIIITRHNDGDRYVWKLEAARPNNPNYYSDYYDGYFNSTDIDQYVEDALRALYETLQAHGMMRYKKDLLNSH